MAFSIGDANGATRKRLAMSEQLYEKASHLLADMNPDGTRTGTIRIPYAYKWPRFQQVEWLVDQALAQNLDLAWARETGLIHRSGELRSEERRVGKEGRRRG